MNVERALDLVDKETWLNVAHLKVAAKVLAEEVRKLREDLAESGDGDSWREACIRVAKELEERVALNKNLQEQVDNYKKALEKIKEPIKFFRAEAEATGCKLDGMMAIQLSDNANYLKEIAEKALEKNS